MEWSNSEYGTVDSRYNAPGYNAVPDITLIISGPRSNKKTCKMSPVITLFGYNAPFWSVP